MDRRKFVTLMGLAGSCPSLGLAGKPTRQPEGRLPDKTSRSLPDPSAANVRIPRISLVACGGAGIAMAREISKAAYGLHEIIAIDTDAHAFQGMANADKTLLMTKVDGKRPSNYLEAQRWATGQRAKIAEAIGQADLAIIVTGLGGAASTGISSVVCRTARDNGMQTRSFATLPSIDEGKEGGSFSDDGFLDLSKYCHNTLAFPFDLLPVPEGSDAQAERACLAIAGLEHYLENTCGSVTRCAFVGNDFEDMQWVLDQGEWGRQNPSSTIGWGEASGTSRVFEATQHALNHPLLFPMNKGKVRGVSVSIRAQGDSLRLEEIGTVMTALKERLGEFDAPIVFSADNDSAHHVDRVRVSVLLSHDPELL